MTSHVRQARLRQQVLQAMVDDNVEALRGLPKGSLRRRRSNRLVQLKTWLVAGAGAVLIGISVQQWMAARAATAERPSIVVRSALGHLTPVAAAESVDPAARARELMTQLATGRGATMVSEVIPLAVRRVAIDPGHGGVDSGTSLGFGLLEKDLTHDIAVRLTALLEAASCQVTTTRSGDQSVSLKDRAAIANAARADVLISIHVNWFPDRNTRGVETYYLGPTNDPFLKRLAAAENQGSGYSLADYRHLLEGIFADVRQTESRRLAAGVHQALYQTLLEENPQTVSRGVMTAPFVVLVATEMPAILVEVACLSNAREARLLAQPGYRQKIADALFGGIWGYAEAISSSEPGPEKGTRE